MQATHNTGHHKAHRPSEGTQSAVRILRMKGRRQVKSGWETLPINTAFPLVLIHKGVHYTRIDKPKEAGHAAAKRAGA